MDSISFDYRIHGGSFSLPALQSHDFYELYFLLEGERTLTIEDRVFRAGAGDFAVIPPFTLHRTEGESFRRVNLYIPSALYDEEDGAFLQSVAGECRRMSPELAQSVFSLLLACFDREQQPLPLTRDYGASILRTLLFLLRTGTAEPVKPDRISPQTPRDELPLQVVSYIRANFDQPLTLNGISGAFHLSHVTLSARFRAAMNCSVMQYVSRVRLNRAKQELAETDLPMEAVAEKCGYSSANYFSLIFKREVGISPSSFRRLNRPDRGQKTEIR